MTQVTNELMYEVLKQIQNEVSGLKDWRTEVRSEFQAVRGHMLAMNTDIANIYARLGKVEERLDRVEKRLGLVDVELH